MNRNTVIPEISIIMPTYNRAEFILEAIESIRNQTFQDWELLIIDDGSEDGTGELISGIVDNRIRFISAGRVGIIGKLKNMGFTQARGMYLAFMDSDDLWAPDKLEKQMALLDQYPSAGFCLTGGFNFKNPGEPIEYYYQQTSGHLYGELLIPCFQSSIAALTPTLVFRRECLLGTGLFNETRIFADIEFMLRIAEQYKGIVLYEPLLYRRLHLDNVTNANWELGYTEYIGLIAEFRQKGSLPAAVARQSLFRLYINYGEKCLRLKQKAKAIRQFMHAWVNKPFSVVPFKKMGKVVLS